MGKRFAGVVAFGMMVAGVGGAPAQSPQQQAEFFQTHYTKREVHIPMRDGVKLFASIFVPIAAQFADKGPYPFLMTRTPYGCAPYGEDKVSPRVTGNQDMLQGGYILVCEDVRGRWASEGNLAGDDA